MKCTLKEIESYKNIAVINRFKKDFPHLESEAETIFKDLLIFFWASEKHEKSKKDNPMDTSLNFVYIMDEAMKPIDQMWHVFLLYTKDYMDFCENYFEQYIHHLPDIVPSLTQNDAAFETNLKRFLSYNYDLLGEDVIKRWFTES